MSDTVKFYYNPQSRGRIVHWMLEECGADYEIKKLEWESGDHKKPEYLAINPMGKIPAIEHRGVVVTECAAICAYLADVFPEKNLAPPVSSPERGTYYRWFFFGASCVEQAITDRKFPRENGPKPSMLGHGSYDDVVRTLEIALKDGFLLKDQFTAADLYMAAQLEWALYMDGIEKKPVFTDYVKKCTDRPGYQSYIEAAGTFG